MIKLKKIEDPERAEKVYCFQDNDLFIALGYFYYRARPWQTWEGTSPHNKDVRAEFTFQTREDALSYLSDSYFTEVVIGEK